MTAGEWHKRRRRVTGAVLAGLSAGAAVCGLVRSNPASAEPIPAAGPVPDPAVAPAGGEVIPPLPVVPAAQAVPIELLPPPAATDKKPADPPKPETPKLDPLTIELPKPAAAPAPAPLPVPTLDLKAEPPRPELPKLDPPKLELPKVEPPKLDPIKVEPPKLELPKVELPKLDLPNLDAPQPEPPKLDPIKIDPTKLEAPKLDPVKIDPPKLELPEPVKIDPTKLEAVKAEPPKPEPVKVEPPKLDLPVPTAPKLEPVQIDPPKLDLPTPVPEPKPVSPVLLPAPKPTEAEPVSRPAEPALPARPAKSAEVPPPLPALPEIPLKTAEPGFKVNPVGPIAAAPAAPEAPPPPGDAAMPLTARQATLTAIVGAALMSAPTRAADDATAKKNDPPAVTKNELDSLKQELAQIKKTLEGSTDNGLTKDGLVKKVQALDDRMATIEMKLSDMLRKQDELLRSMAEQKTTAGSSPLATDKRPAGAANTGFVELVNQYSQPVSMVINGGQSYRLEPGETKKVAVPAGSFRYNLLGSPDGEQTKTVDAGKTVPLWIR